MINFCFEQFYAEASYASSWMREKRPGLNSNYVGKDEDSVLGLIKRLEANQRDLQAFHATVMRLQKLASGLVERGHFDHSNIESKQVINSRDFIFSYILYVFYIHHLPSVGATRNLSPFPSTYTV